MVKVLGIAGSPRRGGNTEVAVGEVLKACDREGAEVELVSLTDFELRPCDGCRSCFEAGRCSIDDDIEKIFSKMREADGIVVGSPVYFFSVDAQTKTFIDRVGYLCIARGRRDFRNKIGGAVAVAGRSGLANAQSQILMFMAACRMIMAAPAVTVLASGKGDAVKDARGLEDARELGRAIVQIAKATSPLRST